MNHFASLLQTQRTVRTVASIQMITGISDAFVVRNMLSRRKKQGLLINQSSGVRTLPHYDTRELASVLSSPSYISLESVLITSGVIFQQYSHQILNISLRPKTYDIGDSQYIYHRIKPAILYNPMGIIQHPGWSIATPERALCDRLYLTPGYQVDNLRPLRIGLLRDIALIYSNRRLLLDLDNLIDAHSSSS